MLIDQYCFEEKRKALWVALGAAILLVVSGGCFFVSSGRDDVHIVYYVVDTLYETGRIANINDESFQQATSNLFVVVLAMAKWLLGGLNTATLAPIFSVTCAIAAVGFAMALRPQTAAATAILLSINVSFVYWAFSGMEAALVALLVCIFLWCLARSLHGKSAGALLAAATALLTVGRPEFFLVITAFLSGYIALVWIFGGSELLGVTNHKRIIAVICLSSAISFGFFLLFNYWHSGYIFPLPVHAKAQGFSVTRILEGGTYVVTSLKENLALGVLMIGLYASAIKVVASKRGWSGDAFFRLLVAGFFSCYLLFIIFAGGVWMEGGRFLVPIIPLACAYGVMDYRSVLTRRVLLVVLLGLSIWSLSSFAKHGSTGMPIWRAVEAQVNLEPPSIDRYSWFEYTNRVHLRDIRFIEGARKRLEPYLTGRNQAALMSMQMGMVPYHFKQLFGEKLEFIDVRALATDHFLKCKHTGALKRNHGGLELDYPYYFEHLDEIARDCGIEPPLFIYDLGGPGSDRVKFIEAQGYEILYQEAGVLDGPGGFVAADQFLAVRKSGLSSM